MPLRIYKGGALGEEGEREQLSQMLDYLVKYFNERNKNTYLAVDPKFPKDAWVPQIDCLFYRDGKIVILELKNINGKFKPTFGELDSWVSVEPEGGEKEINKQRINPFFQVGRQRSRLIAFIINNIRKQPSSPNDSLAKEIGDKINGWIVTAQDSEPAIDKHPDFYWSKVLPLKDIDRSLSIVGTNDSKAITEDEFKLLLKETSCTETDTRDLFLAGGISKYSADHSAEIEAMISSKKPEEIKKAINYCRELSFINYFDIFSKLVPSLPDGLRGDAFSLLYEWLLKFPQKFNIKDAQSVSEYGIKDDNFKIREQTLNFLLASNYKINNEVGKALVTGLQEEKYFGNIKLFIEVLSQLNNEQLASRTLASFYDELLKEPFFYWKEKSGEWHKKMLLNDDISLSKIDEDDQKNAYRQASGYSNVMNTWLKAASEFNLEELKERSLDHLRELIKRLQFNFDSEIVEDNSLLETITALGNMKYTTAVNDLLAILSDFKSVEIKLRVIEALGNIGKDKDSPGMNEAVLEIRKFLSDNGKIDPWESKWLRDEASVALAKLNDAESFDKIWKEFLQEGSSGREMHHKKRLFESLLILDGERLEKILWNEVKELGYSKESFAMYADFIKECATKNTLQKCTKLLLERSFEDYDRFDSPGGILMYIVWSKDELKQQGGMIGLELLKTGRVDLMEIGISIAETHFLRNPDELVRYEDVDHEGVLGAVTEIYVKLRLQDKIEALFPKFKKRDQMYLFYSLQRIAPDMHFESYSLAKDNEVFECEFIIGKAGIYMQTEERVNRMLENHSYTYIPWNSMKYVKRFKMNKRTVGLLLGYEEKGPVNMSLIPRSAVLWNYLIGYDTYMHPGLDALMEAFKERNVTNKESEVGFEQGQIYKDVKAAFVDEENYSVSQKDDLDKISSRFDREFKPEMITVE
jgi:hypothetical protein